MSHLVQYSNLRMLMRILDTRLQLAFFNVFEKCTVVERCPKHHKERPMFTCLSCKIEQYFMFYSLVFFMHGHALWHAFCFIVPCDLVDSSCQEKKIFKKRKASKQSRIGGGSTVAELTLAFCSRQG